MIHYRSHVSLVIVSIALLTLSMSGQGAVTEALFSLESTTTGPFPSDWFRVPNNTNLTHRRVFLPLA